MQKRDVVLYFALNSVVLLIGVALMLCDEKGVSSSLIAAGVTGYIVFWAAYISSSRSKADLALLHSVRQFGITDVNERRLIYEKYRAARMNTKQHFDIMGFGLRNFIEDCGHEFTDWARNFEIRILLIHPDSPACDQRDYEEGDPPGKIRRDVLKSTEFVLNLDDSRVQVRWYRAIPVTNILRMDDIMWVGPYFIDQRSRNAYVLTLKGGSQLFSRYLEHFDRIWNDPRLSCDPADPPLRGIL